MKVNWKMEVTGVIRPVNGQAIKLSEEDKKVSFDADPDDTLIKIYTQLFMQGREKLGGLPFFLHDIKVSRKLV